MKGYYGDIQYRYLVGDTEYLGTRRSFTRVHPAVEDAWQKVIDNYPVGKTVTLYYDPANPGTAVLEPGLRGEMSFLFELDIFCVVSFSVLFLLVFAKYHGTEIRYLLS